MTAVATPTTGTGLAEAVRARLQAASGPLKLAEVVRGLPRQRKETAAQLQERVRDLLEQEVRLGMAFAQPSGKKGEVRYWWRDERQHLRDQAIELATTPRAMGEFKKELTKTMRGVDGDYLTALVKQLIHDATLFEYPAKTKAAGPRFGAARPGPLDAHPKSVDKLLKDCKKLLTVAGVTAEDLIQALRAGLGGSAPRTTSTVAPPAMSVDSPASFDGNDQTPPETRSLPDPLSLDEMILKAVAENQLLSLATLRAEMPKEYQGEEFDATVLRLADELKIAVSQDADPSQFSAQEMSGYVRDGNHLYTTIMARS